LSSRNENLCVRTHCLTRGKRLSQSIVDDENLTVVYGEGGGSTLDVSGDVSGVWIPLRGELQLQTGDLIRWVRQKEALATQHHGHTKAIGHAGGRWLALLGAEQIWWRLLGNSPRSELQLLPELYQADRDLRRKAVALARATAMPELESVVYAIADRLASLQSPLYAAIARCPGRTYARRLQVFLRLQRVRNFMGACCDREIDNDVLARMANYSPCHFLRTFNIVYQETPHAYLVNQRLQRARRLLNSSDLAVTEIALASGFESRSAFSRLFHQRFGTTASETRRQVPAVARASDF
jgi:AraC family transcriptional regulator